MNYEKHALDLLASMNVQFSAEYIGRSCPPFCNDRLEPGIVSKFPRKTHIHGEHWRCVFQRTNAHNQLLVIDFWDSYLDAEIRAIGTREYQRGLSVFKYGSRHGVKPSPRAYDALACMTKHQPALFPNWCVEFGYDNDSRKAYDIYIAVTNEYALVSKFFTSPELRLLQEVS